jgi:hypothetical protein
MSKVDAVLRLVSTNGQQLAWNHDFITLDPRLIWRAPMDQTVVLQIFGFAYPASSEIQLTGGEGAVYRLHLSVTESCPPNPFTSPVVKQSKHGSDSVPSLELPASITGKILRAEDEERFSFHAKEDELVEVRIEAASLGSPLDAWLKIEDQVRQRTRAQ